MSGIVIKGNKEGILIYLNTNDYEVIKQEIRSKIENARDFFAGSKIMIVDDKFKLSDECFNDLQSSLKELLNITIDRYKHEETAKNTTYWKPIYEGKTMFLTNTVRSGQKIIYNGSIVIIGDVNSGAEVIAGGNIIVLGVLRGIAQAGSGGNKSTFVAAYKLQPEQLRIADIIGRGPDERQNENPLVPELAKVEDGMILIEPYLPNKYI